jgi:hypothetical protein
MTVSELMAHLSAYRSGAEVLIATVDHTIEPVGDNMAARYASQCVNTPVAHVTLSEGVVLVLPVGMSEITQEAPPPRYRSETSETLSAMNVGDCASVPKPSNTTMGYIGWLTKKYPGRRFKTSKIDANNTKVWSRYADLFIKPPAKEDNPYYGDAALDAYVREVCGDE